MLSQGMALFERSLNKAVIDDGRIDPDEFDDLSVIYYNLMGEIVKFDRKNRDELRNELENNHFEEIRKLKARQAR